MRSPSATCRLTAILSQDLIVDQGHTERVFDPAIETNLGRFIRLMGDGALVEFVSVIDALDCAVEVNRNISAKCRSNTGITLRIAINLGGVGRLVRTLLHWGRMAEEEAATYQSPLISFVLK